MSSSSPSSPSSSSEDDPSLVPFDGKDRPSPVLGLDRGNVNSSNLSSVDRRPKRETLVSSLDDNQRTHTAGYDNSSSDSSCNTSSSCSTSSCSDVQAATSKAHHQKKHKSMLQEIETELYNQSNAHTPPPQIDTLYTPQRKTTSSCSSAPCISPPPRRRPSTLMMAAPHSTADDAYSEDDNDRPDRTDWMPHLTPNDDVAVAIPSPTTSPSNSDTTGSEVETVEMSELRVQSVGSSDDDAEAPFVYGKRVPLYFQSPGGTKTDAETGDVLPREFWMCNRKLYRADKVPAAVRESTPYLLRREPMRYDTPSCPPIYVNDVMNRVFLFLPADTSTLRTVAWVCRAWRERTEWLPQWHDATQSTSRTRGEYLRSREIKYENKVAFVAEVREQYRRAREHATKVVVPSWLVMVLLVMVLMYIAWSVGSAKNSSSGDVAVGVGALFAVFLTAPLIFITLQSLVHDCLKQSVRKQYLGKHGIAVLIMMSMCIAVSVPLALFGTRLRSLYLIQDAPTITLDCNTTYRDLWWGVHDAAPSYVQFDESVVWGYDNVSALEVEEVGLYHVAVARLTPHVPDNYTSRCLHFDDGDHRPSVFLVVPANVSTYSTTVEYNATASAWWRRLGAKPVTLESDLVASLIPTYMPQSWTTASAPVLRTPYATTYYSSDVHGLGGMWYGTHGGRWHMHRHIVLRAPNIFPFEFTDTNSTEIQKQNETYSQSIPLPTPREVSREIDAQLMKIYAIVISAGATCVVCLMGMYSEGIYRLLNLVLLLAWSGVALFVGGVVCYSSKEGTCVGVSTDGALAMLIVGNVWVACVFLSYLSAKKK
eukprot:PhM_4_TR2446/c0_g1_i3/m.12548